MDEEGGLGGWKGEDKEGKGRGGKGRERKGFEWQWRTLTLARNRSHLLVVSELDEGGGITGPRVAVLG